MYIHAHAHMRCVVVVVTSAERDVFCNLRVVGCFRRIYLRHVTCAHIAMRMPQVMSMARARTACGIMGKRIKQEAR